MLLEYRCPHLFRFLEMAGIIQKSYQQFVLKKMKDFQWTY
jgi:hypothetical protein